MNSSLITTIPNVFSDQLCDILITKFNRDPRKTSGKLFTYDGAQVHKGLKDSTDLYITDLEDWKSIDEKVQAGIHDCVKRYVSQLRDFLTEKTTIDDAIRNVNSITCEPYDHGYVIQKIDKGHKYPWHHDSITSKSVEKGYRVVLSIITYLTTHDKGGTTEFIDGFVAKPVAGTSLVLPATWNTIHTGTEVLTDSSKYILTTCVYAKE